MLSGMVANYLAIGVWAPASQLAGLRVWWWLLLVSSLIPPATLIQLSSRIVTRLLRSR